jgi:hypothetical protein
MLYPANQGEHCVHWVSATAKSSSHDSRSWNHSKFLLTLQADVIHNDYATTALQVPADSIAANNSGDACQDNAGWGSYLWHYPIISELDNPGPYRLGVSLLREHPPRLPAVTKIEHAAVGCP